MAAFYIFNIFQPAGTTAGESPTINLRYLYAAIRHSSGRIHIFAAMQKKVAFILLLILLLNNTTIGQLMRLPVLVAHFNEHKQRDARISVFEYLSMHYWGTDMDDQDDHRDNQLPFKRINILTPYASFIPIQRWLPLHEEYDLPVNTTYPSQDNYLLPNPVTGALFRPPRA